MKRCTCCGTEHADFTALPRVGTMSFDGEVILLANCPCESTLAIVLVPHRDDVRARLGSEHPEAP